MLSFLALICFFGILKELISIYVLELRTLPKDVFWLLCLCTIHIIMLPQTWMSQNILKHKLELLEKGESRSQSSLNNELQDILSAKKE